MHQRSGGQSFLYVTHCFNLTHIALHVHKHIPQGYLVITSTRTALEIYIRVVTPEMSGNTHG